MHFLIDWFSFQLKWEFAENDLLSDWFVQTRHVLYFESSKDRPLFVAFPPFASNIRKRVKTRKLKINDF